MKIGVVADIHCGPDTDMQLGSQSPAMLEAFGEAMEAFKPDLIVDLGDRVNAIAAGQDRRRTVWVRRTLAEMGVPVYHSIGNTDLTNLTKPELMEILAKGAPQECVDGAGFRILLLDSLDPPFERVGGHIGREQCEWLEATLRERPDPCLVFSHHPLDEQSLAGHHYFAARPEHAYVANRARVRTVLEEGRRVRAVFSGHLHWTRATWISGIPYATIGSLVDCGYTGGRPCGAFATVTAEDSDIDVQVHGLLPHQFRFRC
jgi:3',5'-cyclic AMP phosphodiesterase CpdA